MFVFSIGTAVNLRLPDPIFLAAHHETLNWGRLPKPTADPGCDDKTILREWARGPASAQLAAGSLHEYSRWGSGSTPTAIQGHGWGEPRGLGFLPGPSKSSHSCRHVRTPAADEHSCMPFPSLEWASPSGCHHHTLQTPFLSHLLQEALPEAPPLSSHTGTKGHKSHVVHRNRCGNCRCLA